MLFTLPDIPVILGLSMEVYIICFLIALLTFFTTKRLLKSFIKSEVNRKITSWTIAIIVTPLIYLGLIRLWMFGMNYTPNREFEQSKWLSDREERFQMAGYIIDKKMLISKDTSQVKQILGEPTRGMNNDSSFVYDMGSGGGGLSFLFHHLVIKFENNKVASVEHVEIPD